MWKIVIYKINWTTLIFWRYFHPLCKLLALICHAFIYSDMKYKKKRRNNVAKSTVRYVGKVKVVPKAEGRLLCCSSLPLLTATAATPSTTTTTSFLLLRQGITTAKHMLDGNLNQLKWQEAVREQDKCMYGKDWGRRLGRGSMRKGWMLVNANDVTH